MVREKDFSLAPMGSRPGLRNASERRPVPLDERDLIAEGMNIWGETPSFWEEYFRGIFRQDDRRDLYLHNGRLSPTLGVSSSFDFRHLMVPWSFLIL